MLLAVSGVKGRGHNIVKSLISFWPRSIIGVCQICLLNCIIALELNSTNSHHPKHSAKSRAYVTPAVGLL